MKWNDIQAIAFDLDGTLVNSLPDLCAAANHVRETFQLPSLPEADISHFIGDGIGKLVHRVLSYHRDGEVNEADWTQGFRTFIEYYRQHLTTYTRPYPDVETALTLFKARGLPLAVITNKNEILATQLLQQLHLADYFSLIIGGDTLPEKKPSPLPLTHTAHILGLPIQHLLMVGDSSNDILAAKAAGAMSCGVTWGYADMSKLNQQQETKPDIIIDHLSQIADSMNHHAQVEIRT